jgi:hypothetical protein
MSTGELLDRTFTLYKRNFGLFAGIIVPAPAIVLLAQLLQFWFFRDFLVGMTRPAANPNPAVLFASMGRFAEAAVIGMLAWLVGFAITYAATVRAVSAVHLARPISVRQSYSGLHFLRVLAIVICCVAVFVLAGFVVGIGASLIAGVAIAAGAAMGILGKIGGGLVAVAAIVGAVVLVIWIVARYSLAVQACVVEGTKVFSSMKRSVVLSKGSVGRIVVIYLLFVVMNLVIGLTLQFAVGLVGALFHSFQVTFGLQALAAFVAGVLVGPLATVAMSLVYYDERVRKEAFDLQLMMAALDGPSASMAVSAT